MQPRLAGFIVLRPEQYRDAFWYQILAQRGVAGATSRNECVMFVLEQIGSVCQCQDIPGTFSDVNLPGLREIADYERLNVDAFRRVKPFVAFPRLAGFTR